MSSLTTPYEVQERDILHSSDARYLVLDFNGEGCFGMVAKCVNLLTGKQVAIKMHKDNNDDSTQNELEMLTAVRTLDTNKNNIVTFFEGFRFHNLSCLTFEMLDKSVLDLMNELHRTMHLNEIRPITQQLLVAFDALKKIGILHLDLKPDNIMLVNHKDHPYKVKLIDFGLAQRTRNVQYEKIIQPLPYRAPEVALGLPLTEAMDMWAVGCVMSFMYFGTNLLPYHCPYDWMRTIVHLLGVPEDRVLDAGQQSTIYFSKKDDGSPGWRLKTSDEFEEITGLDVEIRPSIFDDVESLDDAVHGYEEESQDVEYKDRKAFLSLLKTCLNVDPQARATPKKAMMNPFITMVHLVDMMGTSSYSDEALQIMYNSHLKDLVESDDSCGDDDVDSSCSLILAGADSIPEDFTAEQADAESNGNGEDGEDYTSEDEQSEKDGSDTDSCISEGSLRGYDADCSDSSTDEEPTNEADVDIIQPSSTDEDFFVDIYSYPYSLPPTPIWSEEDLPTSSHGQPEDDPFNQGSSSSHDGVSERGGLSYGETGAAPAPAQIDGATDCEDQVSAGDDPADGAAADASTTDGAAAAATQPPVQRKKFRNIRKFFSRIRRRVVSYFNN